MKDTALGVASERELFWVAIDVCDPEPCPLNKSEILAVFHHLESVGDSTKNYLNLRAALFAACNKKRLDE